MDDKIFGMLACVAWYFVGEYFGRKSGYQKAMKACDEVVSEVIADVERGDISKWTADEDCEDS